MRQSILKLLLVGCVAFLPFANAQAKAPAILDGKEKSVLVVGYSTSYVWPSMLQELFDDHSGGKRTYHVLNAVIGGAPVETWIAEPGSRDYKRTMDAMVRDYFGDNPRLRGDAPLPMVAIAQQSLQLTLDDRGPVKTEHDMVGAEVGADALEKMSLRLKKLGIKDLWIAMHIYKKPVEPEVGNERIALARLLTRGLNFVHQGPDMWQASKDCFPGCFIDDQLHPNLDGDKMMAIQWYRTLAGDKANEAAIKALLARDYDQRAVMNKYLATRRVAE